MILHTLSASPSSAAFRDCLSTIGAGDALLLLGDGVYAVLQDCLLDDCGAHLHVLRDDAGAAGITSLPAGISWADMDDFVTLSERYPRQMAWY